MILIDGKKVATKLREELKQEVTGLKAKHNKIPGLTVILIGDMAPSQIYVRMKEKAANEVGLKSEVIRYPGTVEEKTVLDKVEELNKNESVSEPPKEYTEEGFRQINQAIATVENQLNTSYQTDLKNEP